MYCNTIVLGVESGCNYCGILVILSDTSAVGNWTHGRLH